MSDATPACTLERITEHARDIGGVSVSGVQPGDYVIIRTKNSTYALAALGGGHFRVSGGWFDTHSDDTEPVQVAGCTWGGRAILTGLVAAPGLFVEFSNGVRTTRVREVRVLRGGLTTAIH